MVSKSTRPRRAVDYAHVNGSTTPQWLRSAQQKGHSSGKENADAAVNRSQAIDTAHQQKTPSSGKKPKPQRKVNQKLSQPASDTPPLLFNAEDLSKVKASQNAPATQKEQQPVNSVQDKNNAETSVPHKATSRAKSNGRKRSGEPAKGGSTEEQAKGKKSKTGTEAGAKGQDSEGIAGWGSDPADSERAPSTLISQGLTPPTQPESGRGVQPQERAEVTRAAAKAGETSAIHSTDKPPSKQARAGKQPASTSIQQTAVPAGRPTPQETVQDKSEPRQESKQDGSASLLKPQVQSVTRGVQVMLIPESQQSYLKLQEQYMLLQDLYQQLKEQKIAELEGLLEEQDTYVEEHSQSLQQLADHWRQEAEKQARIAEAMGASKTQQLIEDLRAENLALQKAVVAVEEQVLEKDRALLVQQQQLDALQAATAAAQSAAASAATRPFLVADAACQVGAAMQDACTQADAAPEVLPAPRPELAAATTQCPTPLAPSPGLGCQFPSPIPPSPGIGMQFPTPADPSLGVGLQFPSPAMSLAGGRRLHFSPADSAAAAAAAAIAASHKKSRFGPQAQSMLVPAPFSAPRSIASASIARGLTRPAMAECGTQFTPTMASPQHAQHDSPVDGLCVLEGGKAAGTDAAQQALTSKEEEEEEEMQLAKALVPEGFMLAPADSYFARSRATGSQLAGGEQEQQSKAPECSTAAAQAPPPPPPLPALPAPRLPQLSPDPLSLEVAACKPRICPPAPPLYTQPQAQPGRADATTGTTHPPPPHQPPQQPAAATQPNPAQQPQAIAATAAASDAWNTMHHSTAVPMETEAGVGAVAVMAVESTPAPTLTAPLTHLPGLQAGLPRPAVQVTRPALPAPSPDPMLLEAKAFQGRPQQGGPATAAAGPTVIAPTTHAWGGFQTGPDPGPTTLPATLGAHMAVTHASAHAHAAGTMFPAAVFQGVSSGAGAGPSHTAAAEPSKAQPSTTTATAATDIHLGAPTNNCSTHAPSTAIPIPSAADAAAAAALTAANKVPLGKSLPRTPPPAAAVAALPRLAPVTTASLPPPAQPNAPAGAGGGAAGSAAAAVLHTAQINAAAAAAAVAAPAAAVGGTVTHAVPGPGPQAGVSAEPGEGAARGSGSSSQGSCWAEGPGAAGASQPPPLPATAEDLQVAAAVAGDEVPPNKASSQPDGAAGGSAAPGQLPASQPAPPPLLAGPPAPPPAAPQGSSSGAPHYSIPTVVQPLQTLLGLDATPVGETGFKCTHPQTGFSFQMVPASPMHGPSGELVGIDDLAFKILDEGTVLLPEKHHFRGDIRFAPDQCGRFTTQVLEVLNDKKYQRLVPGPAAPQ